MTLGGRRVGSVGRGCARPITANSCSPLCEAFENFLPPVLRHLQVLGRNARRAVGLGQSLRMRAVVALDSIAQIRGFD